MIKIRLDYTGPCGVFSVKKSLFVTLAREAGSPQLAAEIRVQSLLWD